MARRQKGKLHTSAVEERIAGDEKRVGPLAREGRKGRIDFAAGAGVDDLDLQAHGAGSRFHVSHSGSALAALAGLTSTRDTSGVGNQLAQELQPLCVQLCR